MQVFAPSGVLAFASLAACVQAHGYISKPAASYEPNTIYTTYNALTNSSINSGFDGGHYNWSPEQNVESFTEHWNATGYASLREMLDPVAPGYGYSLDTADPIDVTGYTEMWWQNDEYEEGFIASHRGPCEAWIDDTRIFHHDDCAAEYTTYPAKVPADYSSCSGDCLFVFYWLALHEPDWQIYKQCVPITLGDGSSTSTTSASTESEAETSTTTAPTATTAAPTATTAAPTATTAAPTATTAAPTATTAAPTATTAAPEATTAAPEATAAAPEATEASAKCTARRQ